MILVIVIFLGRKVDPPAHDPKSGIDYKKAYEKSKEIKSNEERKYKHHKGAETSYSAIESR